MKKFYSMLLCTTVALAASAQTADLKVYQQLEKKAEKSVNMVKANHISAIDQKLAAKAPKKVAAQVADITGDYSISYTVELKDANPYSGETTVVAGTAENEVVINFPFENGGNILTWKVKGTLDPATGELTMSANQASGFNGATVKMLHWGGTAYKDLTEIKATYNGKAIVFDQDDAFGLQAASGGWYTLFDMIIMEKIVDDPNVDPNEGWTSLGNATLCDPWVIPAFTFADGSNQYDKTWEVELQQNDADKNLYRLVDPYKGNFPLANKNTSTAKHGYIQFNVSDPDHVSFDVVEAGFANSQLGLTKMYCYNTLGMLAANYNMAPATIVTILKNEIIYTTYKDGVIKLSSRQEDVLDDQDQPTGEKTTVYDACFGDQSNTTAGYGWVDSNKNPANMTGYILFPGAKLPEEDPTKPEIGGIKYELTEDTKVATVIGCDDALVNLDIPAEIEVENVKYPVTSIAAEAFYGNGTIKSVTIPASVKTVETDAFRNVRLLTNVNIADLKAWCAVEFANGNANPIYNVFSSTLESNWGTVNIGGQKVTTTLAIPEGIDSIGRSFYGFKSLTDVTLPESLNTLGDQAFANCTKIESITIPANVETIGSAFFGCSGLKNVDIKADLKALGNNAFYNCALDTITLPANLESIGMSTFSGNKNLTGITLPASLKSIGMMAFYGCTGIKSIVSNATEVPEARLYAFDDVDTTIPVYVPAGTANAYKAADEWKNFTNYVEKGVSGIEGIATDNDENAAVEYFNLQGVKIANPAAGQVVIRRQGSKITKMIAE